MHSTVYCMNITLYSVHYSVQYTLSVTYKSYRQKSCERGNDEFDGSAVEQMLHDAGQMIVCRIGPVGGYRTVAG